MSSIRQKRYSLHNELDSTRLLAMSSYRLRRIVFFVIILVLSWSSTACSQFFSKEFVLSHVLSSTLENYHFSKKLLNDTYSAQSFTSVIEDLDPGKRFFTQEDIQALSVYRYTIDDQFKLGQTVFFDDLYKRFDIRLNQFAQFYPTYLSKPISLSQPTLFETDTKKRSFADEAQLTHQWAMQLDHQVITTYLSLLETKYGTANISAHLATPNSELEKKAREKVIKDIKRWVTTYQKDGRKERLGRYFDSLVRQWDPHTSFFPPEEKENFDISMSGKLEGIGAVLREEDGYIKVNSVVVGGPAWKQKDLKAEDAILKVAQDNGDFVDLVGMRVNQAVTYIRGKKGTQVRLVIRKPHGNVLTITIKRDVVQLDDTYAKSAIVTLKGDSANYGYISLPVFYHNFNEKDGRNSSDDVRKELEKLNRLGVKGIVLDLRNNSGGALDDAVKMAGLFVASGPMVQVKPRFYDKQVLTDPDQNVVYSGPLIVLINEWSASASEIVAAALQDYKRALIVGSTHSFGKGTVQTIIPLDEQLSPQAYFAKPLGSMKLTVQKFYRITGGATQYRGVLSDIVLPDTSELVTSGERILVNALPYDTISPVQFTPWPSSFNIQTLAEKSQKRVASSPTFLQIRGLAKLVKSQQEKTRFPLSAKSIWDSQKPLKSAKDNFKKTVLFTTKAVDPSASKDSLLKRKEWLNSLAKDIEMQEALFILQDIR